MKLKLIKDSEYGLCVVNAENNDLVEGVQSVNIDVHADQPPMMTIILYVDPEDLNVPNEDCD